MKFFCILDPKKNAWAKELFEKTCKEKSIEYIELSVRPNKLDFVNYPRPQKGDALYRASANNINAKKLEYCLVKDGVATLYSSPEVIFRPAAGIKLEKMGISSPRTIPVLTNDRDILKENVNYLGGFPIIIKAMGGKEGVGIMRVDSYEALYSLADFLCKNDGSFLIRKYIDVRESIRTIVLGERILAAIKYKASREDDFRSNRKTPTSNASVFECDEIIERLSIDSVRAMGLEFGGLDILIDEAGQAHVLEVNFPCQFGEVQEITSVDIAGEMLDYLKDKAVSFRKI